MKTASTICLLVLLVFVQTPVGQFLKIPVLVTHFMKHQKQDDVSFTGFLQEHYASNHNDADLPEDEQLPFKSIMFYSIGNAIVPNAIKANVVLRLPAGKKVIVPDNYTPQQHLASIFHPPRV